MSRLSLFSREQYEQSDYFHFTVIGNAGGNVSFVVGSAENADRILDWIEKYPKFQLYGYLGDGAAICVYNSERRTEPYVNGEFPVVHSRYFGLDDPAGSWNTREEMKEMLLQFTITSGFSGIIDWK